MFSMKQQKKYVFHVIYTHVIFIRICKKHSLTHTHPQTVTHTHKQCHPHLYSLTPSLTHSLTHTLTHTLTPSHIGIIAYIDVPYIENLIITYIFINICTT